VPTFDAGFQPVCQACRVLAVLRNCFDFCEEFMKVVGLGVLRGFKFEKYERGFRVKLFGKIS
jgi:hypothetical protein